MRAVFNRFDNTSKVLIFPADRQLSDQEKSYLKNELDNFLMQWKSHAKSLTAEAEILFSHFIAIAIDNTMEEASGCSKDSLSHKIKELGNVLNIDFFKNGNTMYLLDDQVHIIEFHQIKVAVKLKSIMPGSKVFSFVATVGDLNKNWLVPAEFTWLKKYFKNEVV